MLAPRACKALGVVHVCVCVDTATTQAVGKAIYATGNHASAQHSPVVDLVDVQACGLRDHTFLSLRRVLHGGQSQDKLRRDESVR